MVGRWIWGVLLVAILLLAVAAPSSSWPLQRFFSMDRGTPLSIGELATENAALKARVAELEDIAGRLPSTPETYLATPIYSRYPFNLKHELTVGGGSGDGVVPGQFVGVAATATGTTPLALVGRVTSVSSESAVIMTVFDPRLQFAVRVGRTSNDALFVGGTTPKLTLIAKNAVISRGDVVYAAAEGFPYGLAVGTVGDVVVAGPQLFREATVTIPYDMSGLRVVLIPRSHAESSP